MDAIFHEKQQGSLCAQHCLNALLQGSYFTPVDLATLGQRLDEEERLRMAECGEESEDFRRFLEQPSGNYDDSGYFSVQVISSALEVWGLELVPYNSTEPRAIAAQKCPANMKAFICNYRDHWFTIRRLGHQWFNLNSLLTQPELISDTYLAMFLAQLQQEGYSIFVVFGQFPECDADTLLQVAPAVRRERPPLAASVTSVGHRLGSDSDDDVELQRALRLSLGEGSDDIPDDVISELIDRRTTQEPEPEVQQILHRYDNSAATTDLENDEELQRALRLSLQSEDSQEENSNDLDLEKALKMSLECCDASTRIDMEDLRQRRLNYLEGRSRRTNELPSTSNEATGRVNT